MCAGNREPNLNVEGHTFVWDNESPSRSIEVEPFRAEWRCVTNGEFLAFWTESKGFVAFPASWVQEDGEIKVSVVNYQRFVGRSDQMVTPVPRCALCTDLYP